MRPDQQSNTQLRRSRHRRRANTDSVFVSVRCGMSLLEVLAAVILSSMIAMTGLMFVRDHGQTSAERTCLAHRARLQQDAELYARETGRAPDAKLEAIRNGNYGGTQLPQCPKHDSVDTQTNYRWDGTNVICKYHPGS
ncbi:MULTISPECIES: prepilin-type N-terminal cleavage/methylation domain-containing protein [Pirellulaceae]|uniref:Prepilin-type N-terminal cleavage/methylation domain-containing protein n=1 Tax=Aporhodopirellula rubra TaxID=980271 RepID=A0A7W5E642_9BACT|nr:MULTISPECIES: prepilin-type N-terminal cleavage/methylation domain-containing protein [Pirellulaceae]EMI46438.1 exogenous DNA-binding protein [Rhodopirellula sp. SWK7]MBB3210268.1 prepilin-type N-terminal cleavage/methylation domain-containing protein [Aporhodopirellula rubra]